MTGFGDNKTSDFLTDLFWYSPKSVVSPANFRGRGTLIHSTKSISSLPAGKVGQERGEKEGGTVLNM